MAMSKSSDDRRVQIVLTAFDTLFNKRDYVSAERFWSPRYIQHSAHIPPGREGLFGLVKTLPATLRHENQAFDRWRRSNCPRRPRRRSNRCRNSIISRKHGPSLQSLFRADQQVLLASNRGLPDGRIWIA
jgi:hypothetical protein